MENSTENKIERVRKPDWLRVKLPTGDEYKKVRNIVSDHKLHTICESGNCPNMGECWGAGTATFMMHSVKVAIEQADSEEDLADFEVRK